MTRRSALHVVLMAAFFQGGCVGDFGLPAHERFTKTVALDPKGSFRLNNVNGSVTVETWDQPTVQIEAEKAAMDEQSLKDIEIDVRGQGGFVDVETRMPKRRLFFGSHGKVDYHIRVPRDAEVALKNVNGGVRVEGSGGSVRASTVNGSVRVIDTEGPVDASTVNGSIQADYRKLSQATHEFHTTNGSVTLYLPRDAAGDFEAHTVNGSISSDLPLTISGKIGGRRLTGRVGQGGGTFRIRTVNGSVKLMVGHDKVVRLDTGEVTEPAA
jgi:hypothetical protein